MVIAATVALSVVLGVVMILQIVQESGLSTAITIGFAVVYLVVGLAFIALTLGILRGRNGARITAFALFGLCGVGTAVSGIALGRFSGLLSMAVSVATVVLLVLPASSRWFAAKGRARKFTP